MSIQRQLRMIVLCAVLLPAPGFAATVFKDNCRDKIEDLLARQKANRDKIKNLKTSGTFEHTLSTPKGKYVGTKLRYDYQQSGINRRVDLHYDLSRSAEGKKYMHEGRTAYWVYDGKRTLSYISDTQLASVTDEATFDFQNPINWLNDVHRGRIARSHANFIQWLMARPTAKPEDQDTFSVVQDDSLGRALPAIDYRMVRPEARVHWRWVIDPQAGCEVLKVANEEYFTDGRLIGERSAQFVAAEIAPGIFHVLSGKVLTTEGEEGGPVSAEIVITGKALVCNGPAIAEGTFTFTGMGVKPGSKVADVRQKPAREFVVGAATLSTEKLDAALKARDAFIGASRLPPARDAVWQSKGFQGALVGVFIMCVMAASWSYLRRHETKVEAA